jgi:hypothetical protein
MSCTSRVSYDVDAFEETNKRLPSVQATSTVSASRTMQLGKSRRYLRSATGTGGSSLLLTRESTMLCRERWNPNSSPA